jgi:Na+/proline symporter
LVIAAIFAASLSSVDAAINSCSSVIIIDIYDRLILNRTDPKQTKSDEQQRKQVFVSRIATLLIGVAAIVLASNVGKIGSLYEIMHKVINLFTGPIFGVFLLGMFTKRANSLGVLAGGISGVFLTIYIAFFTDVSFIYTPVFGFLSTFIIGYLFSITVCRNSESDPKWTFKGVMSSVEK